MNFLNGKWLSKLDAQNLDLKIYAKKLRSSEFILIIFFKNISFSYQIMYPKFLYESIDICTNNFCFNDKG